MSGKDILNLADEMRQASLGSFPLSPGIMAGHIAVADLYSRYRRDEFKGKKIEDVF